MRTIKNQPNQRVMVPFKSGSQRTIKLNHTYQQGATNLVFTVILMYGEIPPKSTFRLYASSGEYSWDSKQKIPINEACTCVFNFFLKKGTKTIIDEMMMGVSEPMVVLLMVQAK